MTLLLAFVGGPLIWGIHLALCYFLVALDCGSGWDGARSGIVITTIVGAVAAIAAGVLAWRLGRGLQSRSTPESDVVQTGEFLALGGAMLAPLFAGAIVLAGMSPFFLPMCE